MSVIGSILASLVAILAANAVRWRVLVNRELRRQRLVRVRANRGMFVDPAPGWWLIETCTCTRDGRLFDVIAMSRGWFRTRVYLEAEPAD